MGTTFDATLFSEAWDTEWHMHGGERAALLYLLNLLRPQVSIEIGTFRGGSLRPISHYSKKTYTFDIDPAQHRIAPLFPNTEFITGDTALTLAPVIDTISRSIAELNFVLVDGSHDTPSVRQDINICLKYVPRSTPCVILMHDTANPNVREGILTADWDLCAYAHALDIDFIPGILHPRKDIRNQFWGGIGVGLLLPKRRIGPLDTRTIFTHTLDAAQQAVTARLVD